MDCPNCGTWNPDDKDVCWRCQEELPRPKQEKKRKRVTFLGMPLWVWLAIGLFFVATSLGQCFLAPPPA
jgi:predicted nucleic acid-binding Zn ribbon protein